jgi:hypothetical protein
VALLLEVNQTSLIVTYMFVTLAEVVAVTSMVVLTVQPPSSMAESSSPAIVIRETKRMCLPLRPSGLRANVV